MRDMGERMYIGERNKVDYRKMNTICEVGDFNDGIKRLEAYAEQWAKEGLIVDSIGAEVVAHDKDEYELVHDYQLCYELIPEPNAIDPSIEGYGFVEGVVGAMGSERTGCDLLFVVRRGGNGDYLRDLVAVRKNEGSNYFDLKAKYPESEYIVWHGCVREFAKGAVILPGGGKVIDFYWS